MFIEYPIAPPLPAELIDVDELLRRSLLVANSILYERDGPAGVITELPRECVRAEWTTCIVGRTFGTYLASDLVREQQDETMVALEFRFEQGELPDVYYRGGSPYACVND